MGKTVVTAPVIFFFVVFGILVFGFIAFIVKLVLKAKNDEWSGEVIDKKVTEVEDFDTNIKHDYFYIKVKTNQSKEKNVSVSEKLWNSFEIGDKVNKPKGKFYPEKV